MTVLSGHSLHSCKAQLVPATPPPTTTRLIKGPGAAILSNQQVRSRAPQRQTQRKCRKEGGIWEAGC